MAYFCSFASFLYCRSSIPEWRQNTMASRRSASLSHRVDAMMKVTGWRQHSVRGFLAGVVKRRLKLKLGSAKVDGVRVYRVALPVIHRKRSGCGGAGKYTTTSPGSTSLNFTMV
jgi:hypothetical protein